MRKKLLALLSSIVLTLTGCGESTIKNENAIYVATSFDKKVIDINRETFNYMLQEKHSFFVLLYTSFCSYCQKATENLAKVTKDQGYTTYQMDVGANVINEDGVETFPNLYVVKEGNISYRATVDEVKNQDCLRRLIKGYSYKTNIVSLTSFDSYKDYKKNHSDFMLYTYCSNSPDYNSDNVTIKDYYSNLIYPAAIKSNKSLLIIDKMTAEKALFAEICQDIGISQDSDFSNVAIFTNKEKQRAIQYHSVSKDDVEDLVNSFFEVDSVNSAS